MTNGVIEGGAISIINKSNDFNIGLKKAFTAPILPQAKTLNQPKENLT
jgi:hypothetical protein